MEVTGERLVVARTATVVAKGERAFVELAIPGGSWTTYSDMLGPDDCAAIDREAYHRARTWFRQANGGSSASGGSDPTEVDGASLGRAYELRATGILVAYLRARTVLTRLGRSPGPTVEIREAGEEWALAARSLGLAVSDGSRIGRPIGAVIPDSAVRHPGRLGRALGAAGRFLAPPAEDVVLSESPRWAVPYHDAILRRWSALAVSPGPRLLLTALARRERVGSVWLADVRPHDRWRAGFDLAESSEPGDVILRSSFIADVPALTGWAALGHSLRGRVAVAAQDVTPAARSVLLGLQARGGRVITLEHGISGGYAEQVHSIADHLAVWGPIQAAYHRNAGPSSMDVVDMGWPRLQVAGGAPPPDEAAPVDVAFFDQPATPLSAGSWPEDSLKGHEIVERYADRNPGRRIVVKHHPAARHYRATEVVHRRASEATGDSLSIIRGARVVAAATSTTALEAMTIGRPVIRLVNRGYIGPVDFLRDSGAVVSAADDRAFEAAAEELLSSPAAYRRAAGRGREYAAAFVSGLDEPGAAEGRLVSLVERVLGG
jgi:hypothetical protein